MESFPGAPHFCNPSMNFVPMRLVNLILCMYVMYVCKFLRKIKIRISLLKTNKSNYRRVILSKNKI